ncbi:hypothetical protein RQP46_002348 [Phenoliferia psychrophenolica]
MCDLTARNFVLLALHPEVNHVADNSVTAPGLRLAVQKHFAPNDSPTIICLLAAHFDLRLRTTSIEGVQAFKRTSQRSTYSRSSRVHLAKYLEWFSSYRVLPTPSPISGVLVGTSAIRIGDVEWVVNTTPTTTRCVVLKDVLHAPDIAMSLIYIVMSLILTRKLEREGHTITFSGGRATVIAPDGSLHFRGILNQVNLHSLDGQVASPPEYIRLRGLDHLPYPSHLAQPILTPLPPCYPDTLN